MKDLKIPTVDNDLKVKKIPLLCFILMAEECLVGEI